MLNIKYNSSNFSGEVETTTTSVSYSNKSSGSPTITQGTVSGSSRKTYSWKFSQNVILLFTAN